MEETLQTWLATGISTLTTIVSLLIVIIKGITVFKNNHKDIEKSVIEAMDKINEKTEEKTNGIVEQQKIVINSQQKQIEQLTKEVRELTSDVKRVIDRRVDDYVKKDEKPSN